MKRIDTLSFLDDFDKFKIITDEFNTEYVVFKNSKLKSVSSVNDKTEFEAVENHLHILDNVTSKEFQNLLPIAKSLGRILLCCLKKEFPEKDFFVFVSVSVHDSFIIRFHQKWENEAPYYDTDDFNGKTEKVFCFESWNTGDGSAC